MGRLNCTDRNSKRACPHYRPTRKNNGTRNTLFIVAQSIFFPSHPFVAQEVHNNTLTWLHCFPPLNVSNLMLILHLQHTKTTASLAMMVILTLTLNILRILVPLVIGVLSRIYLRLVIHLSPSHTFQHKQHDAQWRLLVRVMNTQFHLSWQTQLSAPKTTSVNTLTLATRTYIYMTTY